jgi:NAD-dependent SIR2 family protein deacetylase
MTTLGEFDDQRTRDEYLAAQLRVDRIALILGAGISKAFNLPNWDELLALLFARKGEKPPNQDPKRQAEYLNNKFYEKDPQAFVDEVKEVLYLSIKDVGYETLRRCDTLAAIASLAMASRRGSASDIITFNWDDLLEIFLQYHGFRTESIVSDHHWSAAADVTIFHPHGFLPFSKGVQRSERIVFDQMSYTAIMGQQGQLWRSTLVSIMRCRTCVIIGLSGNDDNLDLLLSECKSSHASLQEQTAFWGVTYITSKQEVDHLFWKRRGIYPVVVDNYDRALPEALFRIPQIAAVS